MSTPIHDPDDPDPYGDMHDAFGFRGFDPDPPPVVRERIPEDAWRRAFKALSERRRRVSKMYITEGMAKDLGFDVEKMRDEMYERDATNNADEFRAYRAARALWEVCRSAAAGWGDAKLPWAEVPSETKRELEVQVRKFALGEVHAFPDWSWGDDAFQALLRDLARRLLFDTAP